MEHGVKSADRFTIYITLHLSDLQKLDINEMKLNFLFLRSLILA